ncbi:MAG: O-antigen ligase family protein [Pyrinomonadaceae bacterium]
MSNDPVIENLRPGYLNPRIWVSISLALILISGLIAVPRPFAISSAPWRVDLPLGIFILPLILWTYKKSIGVHGSSVLRDDAVRFIIISLLAFIAWSGASVLWARSPESAIHHTLTWVLYLIVFAIFLNMLRQKDGFTVITGTFFAAAAVLGILAIIDFIAISDFSAVEGVVRIRYAKYAEMMLTVAPLLCISTIYLRNRRLSLFALVIWLLSWLLVMLSLSKGAFIAGIIGHIILFTGCVLFTNKKIRGKALILAGVWIAATILVQLAFSTLSTIPSTTDYISGKADTTRMTSTFRAFTWHVAQKMAADHWLIGVGGDNFGIAVNEARARLAVRSTDDTTPEIAEDYLVERAHNEILQIFAELGVIGTCLIAGLFCSFVYFAFKRFWRDRYRASPAFWAAVGGMTGFFVSSMVSSFSFRAIQNGVVFFMVFAVAVSEIRKTPAVRKIVRTNRKTSRLMAATGIIAALVIVAFSGAKGLAESYIYSAERNQDFPQAAALYRSALRLDPDNAAAYVFLAGRYSAEGDDATAARLLREGIDRGIGVTVTYSLLAKFQAASGDADGAGKTLAEAVSIFPNSVFIRVRYAKYLADQGQSDDSERQMKIADSIDSRQALGWSIMLNEGSVAAFYKAKDDSKIAAPVELLPNNAVFEYLNKIPISNPATDKKIESGTVQ